MRDVEKQGEASKNKAQLALSWAFKIGKKRLEVNQISRFWLHQPLCGRKKRAFIRSLW